MNLKSAKPKIEEHCMTCILTDNLLSSGTEVAGK